MAPEIVKGQPYDHTVDIWCIGVITYVLLCGEYPFASSVDTKVKQKIIAAEYDFPSPHWDHISEPKDFIRKCLIADTSKRSSIKELQKHPWFTSKISNATADSLGLVKRLSRIYDSILANRTLSIAQSPKKSPSHRFTKI